VGARDDGLERHQAQHGRLFRGSTAHASLEHGFAWRIQPDEKRRFYRIARRSATESAAILHIMARRAHVPADAAQHARDLLARIVSMLVRMTKD